MSIQRKFNRQYDKWLIKSQASGADKRWPPTMAYAIDRLKFLSRVNELVNIQKFNVK